MTKTLCGCGDPAFDFESPYGPTGFHCALCGCWVDTPLDHDPTETKVERPMNATRGEVYAAIDSERAYQDMRKQRDQGAEYHSLEEFLLYMDDYLADAKHIASRTWGPEATPKTLEVLRKVVALGVAAMEQHGAPQREGFSRFVRYDDETGRTI